MFLDILLLMLLLEQTYYVINGSGLRMYQLAMGLVNSVLGQAVWAHFACFLARCRDAFGLKSSEQWWYWDTH